ncbi:hypothetical protein SAZ11_58730 [Streptomyces sp. FXJ1.4098]|nr:hypothetical protein [Streptomyces sp. FXJ1.4098]
MLAPAGQLTAVVCGDPDLAGRLADRLGGHAPDDGDNKDEDDKAKGEAGGGAAEAEAEPGRTPSALLGGVRLDEVPLAAARRTVLVQDKDPVLLSGTLAELLDVPRSGRSR